MPPTVEELLERLGVDAGDVTAGELPHNRWLSSGVWRVRTGAGQPAVLKYTRSDRSPGATPWGAHWTARDHDPHRWTYWRREPLAYLHHLAAAYAGSGIVAPACLGVHIDDREALLLLEWAAGEPGESWPVASYGPAVEALGRAQAPFLRGRPLPRVSWLSRDFLREYSSEKPVEWELLDDDDAWQHPVVRETFPAGLRDGVVFVHAHRERLYRISESLPRTLCHLDFWPKNLIRAPGGQVALIDWSFAGLGAVGEDAGNLVPDAAFDHFIPAGDLPRLEQVVFEGYLRGLRAAGWDDDPRLVQLGISSRYRKIPSRPCPKAMSYPSNKAAWCISGVATLLSTARILRHRNPRARRVIHWGRRRRLAPSCISNMPGLFRQRGRSPGPARLPPPAAPHLT